MNNTDKTEQNLGKFNVGKLAGIVYGHMESVFRSQERSVIQRLKLDYNAGQLDHIKANSLVAELVVLERLENELKQQINIGNRAAEELIKKGDL